MASAQTYQPLPRAKCPASAAIALCIVCGAAAGADNYPLLEELNRQTQSLYREVEAGLVRVQLPLPKWLQEAARQDDPLRKWDASLDPEVRRNLEQYQQKIIRGGTGRLSVRIGPATQPSAPAEPSQSTSPFLGSGWSVSSDRNDGAITIEARNGAGGSSAIVIHSGGTVDDNGRLSLGGPLRMRNQPVSGAFSPNNIGLLLDEAGHVLVPICVEKEAIPGGRVRAMAGDTECDALFVGSDDKMQITILRLAKPLGRPVRLGAVRPAHGSLVMLLNPNSGTGRISLWTGGERDYGVVVNMDGSVAGIVRFGQFLGGPACQPVVAQLIRSGTVQRAIVGARLAEIPADSPLRRRWTELADRPALLVEDVASRSLAEKGGLRKGDLVMQVGSEPSADITTMAAMLARGGELRLVVLRDGRRMELALSLPVAPTD